MKLIDAFRNGDIDPYYKQFFKNKLLLNCDCGYPLYIQSNFKRIYCTNPNCVNAKAKRLLDVCNFLSIDGYSLEKLKPIVKDLPYNKLLLPALIDYHEPYTSIGEWLRNTPHTISEIIGMMCLPGFKERGRLVFRNITTTEQIVAILNDRSVEDFICEQTGLSMTPLVHKLAGVISEYLEEIMFIIHMSNIADTKKVFYVAITDDITLTLTHKGERMTKYQYIDYLNTLGGSYVKVELSGALTHCDYIINDLGFRTHKLDSGKRIQASKNKKLIITSKEFFNIFNEEVQSYARVT